MTQPPPTQPSERGSAGRLGVGDWIDAALEIIAEDGVAGVKVQRLCDRLGVTKGSFYWHFADLDALLDDVAAYWASSGGTITPPGATGADDSPGTSLLSAMQIYLDPRQLDLSRSIRNWSSRDARARQSIAAMDRAMVGLLTDAFAELGFSASDSELRAQILYLVGVGFGQVGPLGRATGPMEQLEAALKLLTDTPSITSTPSP